MTLITLMEFISSGPMPSPGIMVTRSFSFDAGMGAVAVDASRCN